MAITFHKDSTVSLGAFIQVLASGRPIGRIFHVNNVYRFSAGDEAQRGEADLQDEDDLEELKDKILAKYSAGRRAGVMAITFLDGSSLGLGFFIQVLQAGRPIGRIFHTAGVYRFYPGDEPTLGAATLQSQDLDRIKDTIRERYRPGGS